MSPRKGGEKGKKKEKKREGGETRGDGGESSEKSKHKADEEDEGWGEAFRRADSTWPTNKTTGSCRREVGRDEQHPEASPPPRRRAETREGEEMGSRKPPLCWTPLHVRLRRGAAGMTRSAQVVSGPG